MKKIELLYSFVPLIFIIMSFTGMFTKKAKLEVLGCFLTMNSYVVLAVLDIIQGKSPGSAVLVGMIWFWSWRTVKSNKFPKNAKRKPS